MSVLVLVAVSGRASGAPPAAPAYAIPVRPMLHELGGSPVPGVLSGFDLSAQGSDITQALPAYMEGSKVSLSLYWNPLGPVAEGTQVKVEIIGSGPVIAHAFPVAAAEWQAGVATRQVVSYAHPRGVSSGAATLRISLLPPGQDARPGLLFAGPCHVSPSVAPSPVTESALKEAFGAKFVRVNASFRLGREATLTVPAPAQIPFAVRAIGLVSSTAYDAHPRVEQVICRIRCADEAAHEVADASVKHGVSTAKADHDFYAPGSLDTRKIRVFSSARASRPAMSGGTFDSHTYRSEIALSKPMHPTSITFSCVAAEGVFDVKEVVLLPAASGTAR